MRPVWTVALPFMDAMISSSVAAVARRAGTSFYWAMRFLPKPQREAMFALYAYCRELDDIADGPGLPEEKEERLQGWRNELETLFSRGPLPETTHPVIAALVEPVERFILSRAEFERILNGMEMDTGSQMMAPSEEVLREYCRCVAGAVGILSLQIFGCHGPDAEEYAETLGEALQLTNILRDLDEDAALGRLYLPREELLAAGIPLRTPAAILADPGLETVCRSLAERAEVAYARANELMPLADAAKLRPARVMGMTYHTLLHRLKTRGWEPPRQPVRLSGSVKFSLAVRSFLKRS